MIGSIGSSDVAISRFGDQRTTGHQLATRLIGSRLSDVGGSDTFSILRGQ